MQTLRQAKNEETQTMRNKTDSNRGFAPTPPLRHNLVIWAFYLFILLCSPLPLYVPKRTGPEHTDHGRFLPSLLPTAGAPAPFAPFPTAGRDHLSGIPSSSAKTVRGYALSWRTAPVSACCLQPLRQARPLLSLLRFPAIGTEVGWAQLNMCPRDEKVSCRRGSNPPHPNMWSSGGRVGIQKGSEKIAALACAGRVKATIILDKNPTWRLCHELRWPLSCDMRQERARPS